MCIKIKIEEIFQETKAAKDKEIHQKKYIQIKTIHPVIPTSNNVNSRKINNKGNKFIF